MNEIGNEWPCIYSTIQQNYPLHPDTKNEWCLFSYRSQSKKIRTVFMFTVFMIDRQNLLWKFLRQPLGPVFLLTGHLALTQCPCPCIQPLSWIHHGHYDNISLSDKASGRLKSPETRPLVQQWCGKRFYSMASSGVENKVVNREIGQSHGCLCPEWFHASTGQHNPWYWQQRIDIYLSPRAPFY